MYSKMRAFSYRHFSHMDWIKSFISRRHMQKYGSSSPFLRKYGSGKSRILSNFARRTITFFLFCYHVFWRVRFIFVYIILTVSLLISTHYFNQFFEILVILNIHCTLSSLNYHANKKIIQILKSSNYGKLIKLLKIFKESS